MAWLNICGFRISRSHESSILRATLKPSVDSYLTDITDLSIMHLDPYMKPTIQNFRGQRILLEMVQILHIHAIYWHYRLALPNKFKSILSEQLEDAFLTRRPFLRARPCSPRLRTSTWRENESIRRLQAAVRDNPYTRQERVVHKGSVWSQSKAFSGFEITLYSMEKHSRTG